MDMTTNTDCTFIRLSDESEPSSVYIPAVMWQDVYAEEVKKYGTENADSAAIYIPGTAADVKTGDFVIMGTAEDTELEAACRTALRVASVAINRYGSKDMQHIKVGAR